MRKLIALFALLLAGPLAHAWDVHRGNSVQFTVAQQRFAAGVVVDDFLSDTYVHALFVWQDGQWKIVVLPDGTSTVLDWSLTNQEVMTPGSLAEFLKASFPRIEAKVRGYLGALIEKPDPANKPMALGYVYAMDVDFDPSNLKLRLNKEPPLSHAR